MNSSIQCAIFSSQKEIVTRASWDSFLLLELTINLVQFISARKNTKKGSTREPSHRQHDWNAQVKRDLFISKWGRGQGIMRLIFCFQIDNKSDSIRLKKERENKRFFSLTTWLKCAIDAQIFHLKIRKWPGYHKSDFHFSNQKENNENPHQEETQQILHVLLHRTMTTKAQPKPEAQFTHLKNKVEKQKTGIF